jgi:dihydrofolate synthase / folylpolyglutamate synthase
MTYLECLDHLSELGHDLRAVKYNLDTMRSALDELGNPERSYPAAIIAGTNGKGSTCAMLASILERAGYRTGLYTSPHLVRVNERTSISGREIPDEEFAAAFTEAWETSKKLRDRGVTDRGLSYFELLTATAFLHFARARIEFAVLEVGMGGRLDATNVVEPRVAVITNVALDHEEFLGSTHASIAREKAGVIKARHPVVSGCEHPEAREVIRQHCLEAGAELLELSGLAVPKPVSGGRGRFVFDFALDGNSFLNLAPSLAGRFQVKNAAAAVAAACKLRQQGYSISGTAISDGLCEARWPGRLQALHHRPLVLLDGAHNPAAAQELAEFMREQFGHRRVRLVYASMRDKSIERISQTLFPLAAELYITATAVERAASPEEILARAGSVPVPASIDADPVNALERACWASADDDVVLVTGSLYLVGAIQQAYQDGRLSLEPRPEPLHAKQ